MTPKTDAAIKNCIELGGELGPEHRMLIETCRELEREKKLSQEFVDAAKELMAHLRGWVAITEEWPDTRMKYSTHIFNSRNCLDRAEKAFGK